MHMLNHSVLGSTRATMKVVSYYAYSPYMGFALQKCLGCDFWLSENRGRYSPPPSQESRPEI